MKTFILYLCTMLFCLPAQSQTQKNGFLSKDFKEEYRVKMKLRMQRRLMEINLSMGKIKKDLDSIRAKGVSESDIDFLDAKERELEKLKKELILINEKSAMYAKGNDYATGTEGKADGKNTGKTVRRDFVGGYDLVTENLDGSVTTVNHLTCTSCYGKGVCSFCNGSGMNYITRMACGCLTGKCGICHGTGEMVTTSVYYPGINTTQMTMPDGSIEYVGPGFGNSPVTTGNEREKRREEFESRKGRYGQIDCTSCWGSGVCETCGGNGYFYSGSTSSIPCPNCDYDHNGRCRVCHGKGTVYGIKDFSKDY